LDLRSASFLGPIADEAIANCHIDLFFFSCTGIDFDRGLSDPNDFQAAFKRRVMQAADRSVCLADHTKLGLRSAFFFAAPNEPDLVITDGAADKNSIARLRSRGGQLSVVGQDRNRS
jgi:DeoR/GlpR family transcriptional regulator of sugar metabolism